MERELPLRITLLRPPPGVRFALQRGRSELVEPVRADADSLVFDFEVRVGERPTSSARSRRERPRIASST
jgi:hypothetical protein